MESKQKKLSFNPECYMEFINAIDDVVLSETPFDRMESWPIFSMGAYIHIPALGDHGADFPKRLYTLNLPQKGIEVFKKSTFDKLPPCASSAFSNRTFVWLSDIAREITTPAEDKAALEFYLTVNKDGLCIPLYGPRNADGYMFIGLTEEKAAFAPEMPFQVQGLAQLVHIRFCQVAENRQTRTKLTSRELDVLELICLGKTNSEIGTILGISSNTVSGYVSQIFLKLGVSDRVSAAMRRQALKIAV